MSCVYPSTSYQHPYPRGRATDGCTTRVCISIPLNMREQRQTVRQKAWEQPPECIGDTVFVRYFQKHALSKPYNAGLSSKHIPQDTSSSRSDAQPVCRVATRTPVPAPSDPAASPDPSRGSTCRNQQSFPRLQNPASKNLHRLFSSYYRKDPISKSTVYETHTYRGILLHDRVPMEIVALITCQAPTGGCVMVATYGARWCVRSRHPLVGSSSFTSHVVGV